MKKGFISILLLYAMTFAFAACSPEIETINEKPGNYLYSENEEIVIIDIETGKTVGNLRITGTKILNDAPFKIPRYIGKSESGDDVYEDVSYSQLIELYYVFENEPGYNKQIGANNFVVLGADGERAVNNPDIEYTNQHRPGTQSFVTAFKSANDNLELKFTYDIYQSRDTAKIRVNLNDEIDKSSSSEYDPGLSEPQEQTSSWGNKDSFWISSHLSYNHLLIISILLFVSVITLSVLMIVFRRRK